MGLWSWAYVSELLATMTGQAPTLPDGELEARQPGSAAEFDNQAWKVARLYAEKVQQKVERGETWLGFQEEEKTKTKQEERVRSIKRPCSSWNTSSVEGKCEWEVRHEGIACSMKHKYSWCKEKGRKFSTHQRSFCRKRIAAGEQ